MLFPFVIGTSLGLVAGYYGGLVDTLIYCLVDVVVAFPFFVLIIALVFALGPGTRNIYIAITIVGWVSYTRIIRGEVLVAKRREYALAARAAGLSSPRILVRHLLPNVVTQAIVFAMSDIVLDILLRSSRSATWASASSRRPRTGGAMIADGQTFITTNWQLVDHPRDRRRHHRARAVAAR